MRKTLLTTFFFPPENGGIQNYLYNLYIRLPKDKVFVLARTEKGDLEFDKKQNFKIFRTSFDSKLKYLKLSNLSFYRDISKIVKQEKIETLALGHPLPLGVSAIWLKKRLGIPYIVFTHGKEIFEIIGSAAPKNPANPPYEFPGGKPVRTQNFASLQRAALKKTLTNAQKIITTTEFMKNTLMAEFGLNKDKLEIIPPGIALPDRGFIAPVGRGAPPGRPDGALLLTVARLVKRKGHHLVIKAIKNLIKDFPNLKYTIVGTGEEKENLKKLTADLKLENHVIFKENVPDEELEKIYQSSDLFIMPSLDIGGDLEGFGLVFLEAAANGLPVIATKTGGIPEAVIDNETGILLPPEPQNLDLAARSSYGLPVSNQGRLKKSPRGKPFAESHLITNLESSIRDLLTNPQKRLKMGQNGRKRVMDKFDWKTQSEKLVKLLN